MRKIHSLQLIHFDIKADNVCYSPSLNKHILIDYGLAMMIKQKVGEKTKTFFRGNIVNCGQ